MQRTPLMIATRAALAALAAAAVMAGCGSRTEAIAPAADQAPKAQLSPAEQIARGRYLVRAADCAACHTAPEGAPFAGGVELASPFGTFYGTNITPDKTHGIGNWSADDFYKALHDGKAPGKQLYPAMPYTSYRGLSRADSDAMYAYLMQVKPAPVANRPHDLQFPYNLRFALAGWNLLFLEDKLPDASQGNSASWQRGRYLSNALGHCAECHTPRAAFGRLDLSKPLAGSALARVGAPDITPAGLAARGWTAADLQQFFATGIAPQGSAFGEMYPVVHLSSQYLNPGDLAAMTTYLLGDQPPAPQPVKAVSADAAQLAPGRRHYVAVCAGCHGREGEGKPHVAVSMAGNSTVRNADARNLLVSMLDGIAAQRFPGVEAMQEMPGFAERMSDEELAQLANYLRATWGGQPADVKPGDVKALRAAGPGH
ncbi:cytochrome c [Cupriavidus taiwanensis]|uniref:cytochrome c n=1 Tax=Cupriavidus taiwanensis TaxID=164546 RepID=UPI000E13A3AA|nr:cytochrome c [Cupriavidus taiwanensis]SOY62858.1 putative Cytochrome c, class I, putative exported protein [Cupriavidus taiwanensis]